MTYFSSSLLLSDEDSCFFLYCFLLSDLDFYKYKEFEKEYCISLKWIQYKNFNLIFVKNYAYTCMYWTGGLCVRFDRPLPLVEQRNFHPHCHCQEADSCCFSFVFPVLVFLECENFSLQQLFGATVNKNIYFTIFKQLFFTRPFQLSFISLFIYKDTLKLILSELGLNWFADKAKIYATSHNILKNSYILNVRQLGPTLPWPWQVSPS